MSTKNRNSFSLSRDESTLFAGTLGGQLECIDVETLEVKECHQAHLGSIETVTTHPLLPYIAAYGKDRRVTVWQDLGNGRLLKHCEILSRDLTPGDGEAIFPSTSQALAFHPFKPLLAGHSGNAGLFEANILEEGFEILHCSRIDPLYDLVTVQYTGVESDLLAATVRGTVYLTNGGSVINQWDFGKNNRNQAIHWFEKIPDGDFLVASDGQRIIRFNPYNNKPAIEGSLFAQDHLEHVTYNAKSNRAYCASFDRNIYEVAVDTAESLGIRWIAPFKTRWIKTLPSNPDVLLVQCRNGGIYKVNLTTSALIASIKDTPDAIWSAVQTNNSLYFAGEGRSLIRLKSESIRPFIECPEFKMEVLQLDINPNKFIKRMIGMNDSAAVCFGNSEGELYILDPLQRHLASLGSAIRDLACDKSGQKIFVACENGKVVEVDKVSGDIASLHESSIPIWALAYNPKRDLLAIGHRINEIDLLDLQTLKIEKGAVKGNRFHKRVRWIDENRMLISSGGNLKRFDLRTRETETLVANFDNTVEDFHWDVQQKYLVVITYSRSVHLFDFESGKPLNTLQIGIGYLKGVLFLTPPISPYPADLLVYGRDGQIHLVRIQDERLITLGIMERRTK